MTTTVTVHVNGRHRATIKKDSDDPVIVEGNYEGSPNPSGEYKFYLSHPAESAFIVTEEYVDEVAPQKQTIDKADVGNVKNIIDGF